MIISKTPFRVSLFGGSTDYENYYSKHGSFLIGFCLDKYAYISIRKTPSLLPYRTRLAYSRTEIVGNNSKILHNGIRGALDYCNIKFGVDLNHVSDLPSQTGIGSSSSFIVGLLNCIYSMKGIKATKRKLAEDAIEIERGLLNEPGGVQDQIWASYGGFNSVSIYPDGEFEVKPLPVSESFKQNFVDRSVLIYTGQTRQSFEICYSHKKAKASVKNEILEISKEAYKCFLDSNIDCVGSLLDKTWKAKQKISSLISSEHVNSLYNDLKDNGVIGAKLLGSGGSGFIFGILEKGVNKKDLKKKYRSKYVSFNLDEAGSKIIN